MGNRALQRRTILFFGLIAAGLLVSFGQLHAEIGFKYRSGWERLIDPTRSIQRLGLASSTWDTLRAAPSDTALKPVDLVDTTVTSVPESPPVDTLLTTLLEISDTLTAVLPETGAIPEDATTAEPDTLPAVSSGIPPSPEKTALGDQGLVTGTAGKPGQAEIKVEEKAPLPFRPTLICPAELPVNFTAKLDTSTNYIVLTNKLADDGLPLNGAMSPDAYLIRIVEVSDRETWRSSVVSKLPKNAKKGGGAIEISIPVFKSKRLQRIFGGDQVGLQVTGDITVNAQMRTEKREEFNSDNPNPTSYQFKVDQTQRFNIKGKVGEKVSVEIDQDSEKLFEFENSLRVTYSGNNDEILRKVEAGNVSLSLPGARFVSGSGTHKGLFGLKTESQVGPLKLITIASLDKGEKQTKKIEGGAESSGPQSVYPYNFIRNRYFFLDKSYRELYRHRQPSSLEHYFRQEDQIVRFEVYKSVGRGEENSNAISGWAFFDPHEDIAGEPTPDSEHQNGRFLPLKSGTDYELNTDLGYIRMNIQLDKEDVLAIAYQTRAGMVYGNILPPADPETERFTLKLLKPKNPQPSDSTWTLMWRHVYSLGSTGIEWDGFQGKITYSTGGEANERKDTYMHAQESRSLIELFWLDLQGAAGEPKPDNQIDRVFVNTSRGELEFPDLRPFDPEGWYVGDTNEDLRKTITLVNIDGDTLFVPELYDGPEEGLNRVSAAFTIVVEYKNVSATYNLGFMVLEGSEEVTLNGQRLSKGLDYTIDYMGGQLTILKREALSPDAKVEIKWETGQMMQLDTKTVLGLRAEYELWEDSYIGSTVMYRSEKTLDQRIRLGSEPLQNSIWDVNAKLTFKPHFLTRAADMLPLYETNEPSRFIIEGEIAQVFPNPNNMDNPSTGDNNGVAYLDDFESVKRSVPLGITRRLWSPSSYPELDNRQLPLWNRQRGRLIWYNPHQQEKITDIWPEREVEAQASKTNVLEIEFQPWWTEWGVSSPPPGIDPVKSWGGIQRYLGAGFADQTQSKYLEIWMNRGTATSGVIYIDLGQISEDVIPDGKLNSEDRPTVNTPYGNGILEKDEDTGIDGIAGSDPNDLVNINGIEGQLLPSYDDWYYDYSGAPDDYSRINGTENNRDDELGRYPDTEDLDGDTYLDQINNFFRYKIDLGELDNNRYIAGGLDNPEDKGWRLYRIPLADTLTSGDPSMTSIEYARIWFTGFRRKAAIRIAQIEIVGNEWQEVAEGPKSSPVEPVRVAVINTHDNPEYQPPKGVSGEVDPVTNLRAKEQSLVIQVKRLGTGESGRVWKHLWNKTDLLDYRYLKMFVHGGGFQEKLVDRNNQPLDLEMFIRLGPDTSRNYYEYSQKLHPGWDKENNIEIDLERLASLKFLREQDSLRNYDILPNGDVIRVVGSPSLGEIREIVIGVKNFGQEVSEADGVEFWVDELRVSDVNRDPGWAARGSMRLDVADLMTITADLSQQDANFHSVDSRKAAAGNKEQLSGDFSTEFQLGKFLQPQWGVRLPLNFSFSQDVYVPKYKPGSDIKLTSLSGESVDIYNVFMTAVKDNRQMSDNPVYETPVDSLITLKKDYSMRITYGKSKASPNFLTHYTLDKLTMSFTHKESYSTDPNYLFKKGRVNNANAGYTFGFDKPWELNWFSWAVNTPVLNKISDSKLRPLPETISAQFTANESYDVSKNRGGSLRETDPFAFDRTYSANWMPITPMTLTYGNTINADRVRQDEFRTEIARRIVDSLAYRFIDPVDSLMKLDTTAYNAAIEKKKKELFWSLFSEHFIDNNETQRYSMSLRPQLTNWLSADGTYSSTYQWSWREPYGPGDRGIGVNSSLTTNVTLGLPVIINALGLGNAAGKKGPAGKSSGAEPFGAPFDEQAAPKKKGSSSNKDPFGGQDPFGGNFQPPEMLDTFDKSTLPPEDQGLKPSPTSFSDEEPLLEPLESSSLTTLPDVEDVIPPEEPAPSPLGDEKGAADDTTKSEAPIDTTIQKPPKRGPNAITALRAIFGRLQDVRWQYNQTNGIQNSAVGEGHAQWPYRLGLTKDPKLDKAPGNWVLRDSYRRTDEHNLSTGLQLTRTLRLSNLSYAISSSKTTTINSQTTGTDAHTVWYQFEEGGTHIKEYPILNWTLNWTGLGELEFVQRAANSVTVENTFRGNRSESWRGYAHPDSQRTPTRIEYEKSFSPLVGVNVSWKGGVGSTFRYNYTINTTDERIGRSVKNRGTTKSIDVSANYTSKSGFRIPIPVWPFKNKRFSNSTNFALAFSNRQTKQETSADQRTFTVTDESKQWSISPSIDYSFSSSVKGGIQYQYGVQDNKKTGKVSSQEFSFRVSISIRG